MNNKKKIFLWLTGVLIGAGLLTSYVLANNEGFEDGSLVKIKDQKTVYLIEDNLKKPFISAEAYKAYGYSWYDVDTVEEEELKDYETGPLITTPQIMIKANKLFIRKWPNRFGKILGTAQKDEKYELIDNNGSWYKIKGGDKIIGWISARYALIIEESENEDIAKEETEEIKNETPKTEVIEIKKEEPIKKEITIQKSLVLTYLGNEKLSWKKVGEFPKGYKLVWSKYQNPTYPTRENDKYNYYSEPDTTSGSINAFDGSGKYYVRVCEYLGGKCGIYSNQIIVTLGSNEEKITYQEKTQAVTSISLTSLGDGTISWKVNGYSKYGFKVVWSKNTSPTYPTREEDRYHYYSESNKTTDTVDAFDGEGSYYVRVCEYLGGKCGTYSNEIKIEL